MDSNIKKCMDLHKQRKWDNGKTFLRQISPTADPSWFNQNSTTQQNGQTWYEATDDFWKVHCGVSHPNDGSTCRQDIHVNFLTLGGSNAEVEYGVLHPDNTFVVQDAQTFGNECEWWASNFNSQQSSGNMISQSMGSMLQSSSALGTGFTIFLVILVILFVLLLVWLMVNLSRKRKSSR